MTLRDDAARTRARTETGTSFLVEAAAGTGKTTTLISRILTLVLEREIPLGRIAAMTFTEKAAGEMKTKLRQELEKAAASGTERAARARRAVLELESAEVSTIHSFCARLLRERPVEAGVDPDFVAGDELLASDLADEAFDGWFDREARRAGSPVAAALLAGAEPEGIRQLAVRLYDDRLVLDRATLPTDAFDEVRGLARGLLGSYEPLLSSLPSKKDEKKRQRIGEVLSELRRLVGLPDGDLPAADPDLSIDLRGSWPEEVKERISSSRRTVARLEALLPALPFVPALTALVTEIRSSFFRAVEEAKSARGVLDF
ncbi:MAG TPA: UvrD-helicase domain-containing protein, partial [Thermoanaerobaculia bacterium]|nr:UvrD-helicase domain-containing protein [Thermoanaerobaculia bacterium]